MAWRRPEMAGDVRPRRVGTAARRGGVHEVVGDGGGGGEVRHGTEMVDSWSGRSGAARARRIEQRGAEGGRRARDGKIRNSRRGKLGSPRDLGRSVRGARRRWRACCLAEREPAGGASSDGAGSSVRRARARGGRRRRRSQGESAHLAGTTTPRGASALPQGSGENDDRWGPCGLHWSPVGTFFLFIFNYSFSLIYLIFANFKTGPYELQKF